MRGGSRWRLCFAFALVVVFSALSSIPNLVQATGPTITPNDQFGINFISAPGTTFSNQSQRYSEALGTGAGWNRWPIYWSNLETQCSSTGNGTYDWSQVDPVVNADAGQGLKMDAILLGTPACYATSTSSVNSLPPLQSPSGGLHTLSQDSRSPPTGLYAPTFADGTDTWWVGKPINPANPWARFVYSIVSRYHGNISYWEIWNEPDYTSFWTGTLTDYVRLLKVAYLAAHAADPSAHIMVGGMMYWQWANEYGQQAWLKQFLAQIMTDPTAPANGYYFDVIPWHWYSRSSDVYNNTLAAETILDSYGLQNKELWLNETNSPACNDPVTINGGPPSTVNCGSGASQAAGFANDAEQASFVIQAAAEGFAAGMNRVLQFQLQDDGNGEAFGLFRNDGSSRPAYPAYQLVAQYVEGFTTVVRTAVNGTEMVTFGVPGPTPHRTTILWNDTGGSASATVQAAGVAPNSVSLIGQDGTQQGVNPAKSYSIALAPATDNRNYDVPWNPNDYVVGGSTDFLVEYLPPDTTPPVSTIAPLPATTTPIGFALSWSGTDSGGWGVLDYTIQYRDLTAGGLWVNLLTNTIATSTWFYPVANHSYQFRSLGRDWAGNVESKGVNVFDAATVANGPVLQYYLPVVPNGSTAGW